MGNIEARRSGVLLMVGHRRVLEMGSFVFLHSHLPMRHTYDAHYSMQYKHIPFVDGPEQAMRDAVVGFGFPAWQTDGRMSLRPTNVEEKRRVNLSEKWRILSLRKLGSEPLF